MYVDRHPKLTRVQHAFFHRIDGNTPSTTYDVRPMPLCPLLREDLQFAKLPLLRVAPILAGTKIYNRRALVL